jgi:cytochrome c-type biogenesis protein
MMEPVVTELKEHYQEQVVVIVADLDHPQTQMFFGEFDVLYIPAFFFINQKGVVLIQEAGVFSLEEMKARVAVISVVEKEEKAKEEEKTEVAAGGLERFFSDTIPAVVGERSLLTFFLVFLGGLITSISPCILSMVPLLVGYIGGYAEGTKSKGFKLSLSFITGMALTFAILGFIAAYFGRVFGQIGTVWYYILAAVALIMGLQLLGVLTFNLPGLKKIPIRKAGISGSMIMGLLFGLVASPCATPVLAVIITYAALQAEPFYGSILLFIYGLGHGLPLLAAGTFTGMAKNLPKFSRYTQYLSYFSGLILVLAGFYLLYWIGRL